MLTGLKAQAIGLYGVNVADWGIKRDIAYRVRLAFLQDLNTIKEVFQVGEDDRLSPKGISRGKEPAVALKSTLVIASIIILTSAEWSRWRCDRMMALSFSALSFLLVD